MESVAFVLAQQLLTWLTSNQYWVLEGYMSRSLWKQFATALVGLASLLLATEGRAALIDFTTLQPQYNDGVSFVPGVPPGWTNIQQPNLLSISNGTTLGDGPHNILPLPGTNQVSATVEVDTDVGGFDGTFGGFFIDVSNGFFGVGIGANTLAMQYGLFGEAPIYNVLSGYSGGPLFLQLERAGDAFSAFYSTNGVDFTLLYSQTGLLGDYSQLDLTSFGAVTGLTINFSNLDATASRAVPEPATWTLILMGFALLFARRMLRDGRAGV
jgi:hypothetical protein